jgi:hypothetical protein
LETSEEIDEESIIRDICSDVDEEGDEEKRNAEQSDNMNIVIVVVSNSTLPSLQMINGFENERGD